MITNYSIWAEVHDGMIHDAECDFCGSTRNVRTVDKVLNLCEKCAVELERDKEKENENANY